MRPSDDFTRAATEVLLTAAKRGVKHREFVTSTLQRIADKDWAGHDDYAMEIYDEVVEPLVGDNPLVAFCLGLEIGRQMGVGSARQKSS